MPKKKKTQTKGGLLVGVDIGGTFTDLVLSENGWLSVYKLPSTPDNPATAMLDGLKTITADRVDQLNRVAHGSTVATNAILERKGARVALITTRGFRDVLHIGRQNRPDLYALYPTLPPVLIPRDHCFEVTERLDHNGDVVIPLDDADLNHTLDMIESADVDAVAVCLLYSYVNAAHERAIQTRIFERGMFSPWQVALSSDVLPEFREYERASTVSLEAYVRPVMSGYISQLDENLPDSVGLRVMKSDGGVIGSQRVRHQAIQTALSGPAAGVLGAYEIARSAGFENIITLDMGGTSTDVAICPGGLVRRPQSEIDGLPLRIRLLDIETIGAGGGSIARLDSGGALRVGPESAGADPGPAVYGRGGEEPTVSDANAILGRLDPANFLGGNMSLDLEAGETALRSLAEKLDLSLPDLAFGILDIANVNIDRALRRVSVARGYDPRHFTMVAFGGAGALHACDVANRLQIPRVLVPRYPGVLCAFGLLVADVVLDYAQSVLRPVAADTMETLTDVLEEMLTQAKDDLIEEGVNDRQKRIYNISLDMRYQGQAYELNIPLEGEKEIGELFHSTHELRYGHSMRERVIEVVNLRVQAIGLVEHPPMRVEDMLDNPALDEAYLGEKTTTSGDTLALYDREFLLSGARFSGGALVFQMDSTTYIPPGWHGFVDSYRNLILERE